MRTNWSLARRGATRERSRRPELRPSNRVVFWERVIEIILLILLAMLLWGFTMRRVEAVFGPDSPAAPRVLGAASASDQPLQVAKPNGGKTYVRRIPKRMKWSSTLDPSEKVRIEVWRVGSRVHVVDQLTRNDGVYRLTFPQEAELGTRYKMRGILVRDPYCVR